MSNEREVETEEETDCPWCGITVYSDDPENFDWDGVTFCSKVCAQKSGMGAEFYD